VSVTRRTFLAGSIATGTGLLAGCPGPPRQAVEVDCPATVPTESTARIGFVGDVMLGRNVNDRWRDGPAAGVWGSTAEYLQSLDGLVLNLECCLSDRGQRRPGRTYYFRADPEWAIPALQAAGTSFASLANNHVLDFGRVALEDTLANLSRAGIAHAGAGLDREAAVEPALIEVQGIEIAVLALTDQSPSYAALAGKPGTAYADLSDSYPARHLVGTGLERARELDPDLTVATLHWGPNWKTVPSGDRQAFARWLIDRGVDVVHGHSAHVIQGVEVYRGRPIVYDAGDFVDDYVIKPDLHNDRSFCFELQIADGRLEALDLRPVEIDDERVERAGDEAAAWLRDRMRSLSEPFGTTVRRNGRGLRIPLAEC
jgi:poly-gamma-glutamate synthesis protein (capsule biosynthesis protein)